MKRNPTSLQSVTSLKSHGQHVVPASSRVGNTQRRIAWKPSFRIIGKIFIEERIYKEVKFEQSENTDAACEFIDERLTPFYPQFIREVTKEDILKLLDIKMARILKFNKDKADENIARIKEQIEEINNHLAHIVEYTIDWYQMLKDKYGKQYPRRTELRNFDTIEAAKVVEANEKLYINREEGFIGTALKKMNL